MYSCVRYPWFEGACIWAWHLTLPPDEVISLAFNWFSSEVKKNQKCELSPEVCFDGAVGVPAATVGPQLQSLSARPHRNQPGLVIETSSRDQFQRPVMKIIIIIQRLFIENSEKQA